MGSYQDKLAELGPGKMLAALPIDSMIAMLGKGVAQAQHAMDENAITTAVKLGETMLELPHPDDPSMTVSRSLLSLGFLPTFYQFTECSLELRIEMKYQVEETEKVGVNASVGAQVGPVAIAASVSAESGRKFGMDASMMTHVKVNMVSVPPPQAFVEYVKRSLA